jgi:2-phosphosulfolactate phosphatase
LPDSDVVIIVDVLSFSTAAVAAQAVYRAMKDRCPESIHACASGQELIAAGYADDVAYAVAENVSRTVPRLVDGAYRDSGDD